MSKLNLSILGMGHIGSYVYETLFEHPKLNVSGYDVKNGFDLSDYKTLEQIIMNSDGVIAATPFMLNKQIATLCNMYGVEYFDLTESNEVTDHIKNLDVKFQNFFVSQCGLAPGMVSVIANNIAKQFKKVKSIAIRVGALPSVPNNHMGYSLTWNTEGLINEYIHPCKTIIGGKLSTVEALEDMEPVNFNGIQLEAATTSGGIGSLTESWLGKADAVNYKTLRYPGHWKYMKFLKDDLELKENFDLFKLIFNKSVARTNKDRVFILIKVTGFMDENESILEEKSYSKIIESTNKHTAIQISTGSGIMSVVDIWANGKLIYVASDGLKDYMKGFLKQENLPYEDLINSPYCVYRE